jgi:hypothetical protein
MIDVGDSRPISDALLTQRRRVPDTRHAALPDLLDYRGLDTPFPFTLTIPQRRTEHAPAAYLGVCGGRVRSGAEVLAAGQSANEARVQVNGARHAARYLAGTDGAHSPSWLARTSNTGRRDAASLAWNWLPRAPAARTHMQHSVTVIPAVN